MSQLNIFGRFKYCPATLSSPGGVRIDQQPESVNQKPSEVDRVTDDHRTGPVKTANACGRWPSPTVKMAQFRIFGK